MIWNEWFRDQNLQNSLNVPTGDGPDTVTDFVLQKRCKRHDYFTSCLPWPQKGPGVNLPLGTSAPITGLFLGNNTSTVSLPSGYYDSKGAGTAGIPVFQNTTIQIKAKQSGAISSANLPQVS